MSCIYTLLCLFYYNKSLKLYFQSIQGLLNRQAYPWIPTWAFYMGISIKTSFQPFLCQNHDKFSKQDLKVSRFAISNKINLLENLESLTICTFQCFWTPSRRHETTVFFMSISIQRKIELKKLHRLFSTEMFFSCRTTFGPKNMQSRKNPTISNSKYFSLKVPGVIFQLNRPKY